jgi:HEAT repeat protein
MRSLTKIGLVWVMVGWVSVAAAHEGPHDDGFDSFLRAIDVVAPAQVLESRWSDVRERLMAAAADDSLDSYARVRATSILGNFPEKEVRTFLTGLTASTNVDVRRQAYYTLGRAFGDPGDADLVAVLRQGVGDEVSEVREHCVRVLRWVGHQDAVRLLEEIAKSSSEQSLRELAALTLSRRDGL